MAFLPNIFNRQQNQQQPQQQQPQNGMQGPPQQQQPMSQNGSAGPAANQQQPANSQYSQQNNGNPQAPQAPQTGLDSIMALMKPKEGQQPQPQQQPKGLFGDLNADAVKTHAKQANFAAGLNPELVQKAMSGDAQAFMEAINSVAQEAFAASVSMSQGLVEHGVKTGTDQFSSGLDSRFKDYELRNQNPSNKALQHPLAKSFITSLKKGIAAQNPQMSAAEIHQAAETGFLQFTQEINAKPEGQEDPTATKGTDWTKYLGDESM